MTTGLETAFAPGDVDHATLKRELAKQSVYVCDDLSAITAEDFSIQPYGAVIDQNNGAVYTYDPDDTISAHDGSTVLVVSGRRYLLRSDVFIEPYVLSSGDTTPPVDPALGDRYVIGAAPSGDWATKAKHIATWAGNRWVFQAPTRGMIVAVQDVQGYQHYNWSDAWTEGIPVSAIAAGSLSVLQLAHPLGLPVEGIQNDPPGSMPLDGTAYIVGTSPTGAWIGETSNVAYVDGGAYSFISAYEGATAFNKDAGLLFSYRSGVWVETVPRSPKISCCALNGDGIKNFF